MICDEARILVSAYQDGELPPDRKEEVERHLKECASCGAALKRNLLLSEAIRSQAPTYRAPDSFFRAAGFQVAANWRPFASGLAIGLAGVLVVMFFLTRLSSRDFTADLVSSHVRSMMADHLFDVASTDKHTVKPWFLGKLDFSPSVPDLTADGFPLVGGRLDYVDHRPAAALVYRRAKHVINVLVLKERVGETSTGELDGYHVEHWKVGNLDYWAVSDVAKGDLADFSRLFQSRG